MTNERNRTPTRTLIRVIGIRVSRPFPGVHYLAAWNNDAHQGQGYITLTRDPERAFVFHSLSEAVRAYQSTSVDYPVWPNDVPNQPLTAFNVEFVEEAVALRTRSQL